MSHFRLIVRCDQQPDHHAKILRVDSIMGRPFVDLIAGVFDGRSPMYIYQPGPQSTIGKCATCGSTLTSEIEERADDLPTEQLPDEAILKLTHAIFADEDEGDN